MRILVTGAAGFIGYHTTKRLLADGHSVTGLDAMTPYYDPRLKEQRLDLLRADQRFTHHQMRLEDKTAIDALVDSIEPEIVVHLAAQAGVRYSLEQPGDYVATNLVGTFNLLEALRRAPPRHLLIASTSSVYGANEDLPFSETDRTDWPVSLYAATKKACEAMSHSYAHLFAIPTTCFRFFTVYGPWGRPDMALFKFVEAMTRNQAIEVYGEGRMRRDFTYVDDLVEAITRLMGSPPRIGMPVDVPRGEDSLSPAAPWRSVNIAGGQPSELMAFIAAIEAALGKSAEKVMLPMQPGDVVETGADPALLEALIGYKPTTSVTEGVKAFVDWYLGHYADIAADR
ncbi:UDP-glucuronate 5'-epimerase [Devosia pacifica]|uniref:UDP-glucuronate 5'-epimerase n=1 Tax=Devosia pacifica TaxID=1335967 RepID=A0A918VV16_9HYPH|nr:SDR family NAD(P)-dependent oxidoreductase [Devosia pacifica]GHA25441.1 UDP-glucuronate 5'-epimerase [Devosia pacifica]